jgi:hypothetical protein
MEFERRTKRGKAAEAAQNLKRETSDREEYDDAQANSAALQEGLNARDDSRGEEQEPAPVAPVLLHNLDVAQQMLANGEVSGLNDYQDGY